MKLQKNRRITPLWRVAVLLCLALACHAPASYAEQSDRNKPVHLESDRLSIDDARQISTFEGNVQLSQGTMMIRGDKVIVTQDKSGVKHGTAIGQPASHSPGALPGTPAGGAAPVPCLAPGRLAHPGRPLRPPHTMDSCPFAAPRRADHGSHVLLLITLRGVACVYFFRFCPNRARRCRWR